MRKWLCAAISALLIVLVMPFSAFAEETVLDAVWDYSIIYNRPNPGETNQASSLFCMNQVNNANDTYKLGQLVSKYDPQTKMITLTNKHAKKYNQVYDKILSNNNPNGFGYFIRNNHQGRNYIAIDAVNNSGVKVGVGLTLQAKAGDSYVRYFEPDSNYYLMDENQNIVKADTDAWTAGLGSGTTDYYCLLPAGFKGTIYVDMAGFRNLGGYTFDQIEAVAFEIRSAASAAAASEQNPQNLEIQLGNFRLTQNMPKALTRIEVSRLPDKLICVKDENLSLDGGELTLVYGGGYYDSVVIPMNDPSVTVSIPEGEAFGIRNIELGIAGQHIKTSIEINVLPAALKGISVKTPPRTQYAVNDCLNAEGGVLTLLFDGNQKAEIPMETAGVEIICDTSLMGKKKAKVLYGGFEAEFMIEVLDILVLKSFNEMEDVQFTQPADDDYTFAKGTLKNGRLSLENIPNEDKDTYFIWSFKSSIMGQRFAAGHEGYDYVCFDVENNTGEDVAFTSLLCRTGSVSMVSDNGYLLAERNSNPVPGDHMISAIFPWSHANNRCVIVPAGFSGIIMMSLKDFEIKQGPYNGGTEMTLDEVTYLDIQFRYGGDKIIDGNITVGDIFLCKDGFIKAQETGDDSFPAAALGLVALPPLTVLLYCMIFKKRQYR